jgi:hypothetical protein
MWSDPFCRRNASRKHQELEFLKHKIIQTWRSWSLETVEAMGSLGSWIILDHPGSVTEPWRRCIAVYCLRRLLGRLLDTLILCNVNFSQTKKCYGHNHAIDYIYPIRTLLNGITNSLYLPRMSHDAHEGFVVYPPLTILKSFVCCHLAFTR